MLKIYEEMKQLNSKKQKQTNKKAKMEQNTPPKCPKLQTCKLPE